MVTVIPSKYIDKQKLFAEQVKNSKHLAHCLECGLFKELPDNGTSDDIIDQIIEIMSDAHSTVCKGGKMVEVDDLQ